MYVCTCVCFWHLTQLDGVPCTPVAPVSFLCSLEMSGSRIVVAASGAQCLETWLRLALSVSCCEFTFIFWTRVQFACQHLSLQGKDNRFQSQESVCMSRCAVPESESAVLGSGLRSGTASAWNPSQCKGSGCTSGLQSHLSAQGIEYFWVLSPLLYLSGHHVVRHQVVAH